MIVKKIGNPGKSASKSTRIYALSNYILSPTSTNRHEKCVYFGTRGFFTDQLKSQQAEMLALAQEAVRSKDTINHYVLSWHEGEQPSAEQIEELVDIFLGELDLHIHQCMYGLHADTGNLHLHLVINRVDPESIKVIKPNQGFDIKAAHKAVARIEHAQGWLREPNGCYRVLENGELGREHHAPTPRQPAQSKRDKEHRTGEKSAERIAIEEAAPIIQSANCWSELHRGLAKCNMRYQRSNGGAVVFVGAIAVKASRVLPAASLNKLQKRLGPFEHSNQERPNVYFNHVESEEYDFDDSRLCTDNRLYNLSECGLANYRSGKVAGVLSHNARTYRRQPAGVRRESKYDSEPAQSADLRPVHQNQPLLPVFLAKKQEHFQARNVAKQAQKLRHQTERQQLIAQHKKQRNQILDRSWQGLGVLRNALQSVLAAEQKAGKLGLQERQKIERTQLSLEHQRFPGFEEWLRDQHRPELAEAWRNRTAENVMWIFGDSYLAPALLTITGFNVEIEGLRACYRRSDGSLHHVVPAFVDSGRKIEIYGWQSNDVVLGALQIAAKKWGDFYISGNDEYISQCIKLAAKHEFSAKNFELKNCIEQEQQRLKQAVLQVQVSEHDLRKPDQVREVDKAVRAFMLHFADISHQSNKPLTDSSRNQNLTEIAVRMKATGHSEMAVKQAFIRTLPSKLYDCIDQIVSLAFSDEEIANVAMLKALSPYWIELEKSDVSPININKALLQLSDSYDLDTGKDR
ncbi:TraI/MobA(P) family conjugative relaxase [uncultured Deefgea sp.]|uniref:TraI/MobA(P) family conjugative relaxase n=1 Tax=uncultured Deefgea sp. TaxID=1304914 RepID=UPI002609A2A3|nr:TraI/MobA(P) family conjugative relaxase [uncultured Deefgea sp.]